MVRETKVAPNSHRCWEVEYEFPKEEPGSEDYGPQYMSVWVETEEQARREAESSLTAIELFGGVADEFVIRSVRLVSETEGMIFVFGSNEQGIHGGGAAKFALDQRGAKWGVGEGPTGRCYAIPTKRKDEAASRKGGNLVLVTRSLAEIMESAKRFDEYAFDNPHLTFQLTAIGCGLAGLRVDEIAPMFELCPDNVKLPPEFREVLAALPDERFWSYPPGEEK